MDTFVYVAHEFTRAIIEDGLGLALVLLAVVAVRLIANGMSR